ncbi:hypothetical protein J2TS4_13680 [Paenibacillus sp. J2TS4]|nr:hypothetical protein J2TS4_13680 [Paenibacillus sp. J2TS4]
MFYEHLALTKAEAVNMIAKDFKSGVSRIWKQEKGFFDQYPLGSELLF